MVAAPPSIGAKYTSSGLFRQVFGKNPNSYGPHSMRITTQTGRHKGGTQRQPQSLYEPNTFEEPSACIHIRCTKQPQAANASGNTPSKLCTREITESPTQHGVLSLTNTSKAAKRAVYRASVGTCINTISAYTQLTLTAAARTSRTLNFRPR